jgi:phage protein D
MRHCEIMLEYLGKDVTADILPFFQSLTYDEVSEGLNDTLSLSLTNTDQRWFDAWLPQTGDELHATIVSHDWNYSGEVLTLDLENMVVDDPEFSGPPDILTLKALNVPLAPGFTDLPGDTTWQSISMKELAQEIASRYNLALQFDAQDFTIKALKRTKQSDAALLNATAQKYNLCLKVYSKKIVIYSKHAYEQLPPVCTITRGVSSIQRYTLQNPLIGTGYTGCTILYKKPTSKELICRFSPNLS